MPPSLSLALPFSPVSQETKCRMETTGSNFLSPPVSLCCRAHGLGPVDGKSDQRALSTAGAGWRPSPRDPGAAEAGPSGLRRSALSRAGAGWGSGLRVLGVAAEARPGPLYGGGTNSVSFLLQGQGGGPTSVPFAQQGLCTEWSGGPTSIAFAQQGLRNCASGGRTSAGPPHHLHVICCISSNTEVRPTRRPIIL